VLIAASCDLSAAMPGARLVAPPPTLGALERQLSAAWVTGAARADGRYVLAEKRLSRPAQAKFDVVLINAPPRLSIGAINALTAATHLVIPTTVDRVSCEAVATFVELYEALKPALFPQLALAGWYWRGRARTRG
jgi:cellulose biosynthesis protein BcsQ